MSLNVTIYFSPCSPMTSVGPATSFRSKFSVLALCLVHLWGAFSVFPYCMPCMWCHYWSVSIILGSTHFEHGTNGISVGMVPFEVPVINSPSLATLWNTIRPLEAITFEYNFRRLWCDYALGSKANFILPSAWYGSGHFCVIGTGAFTCACIGNFSGARTSAWVLIYNTVNSALDIFYCFIRHLRAQRELPLYCLPLIALSYTLKLSVVA